MTLRCDIQSFAVSSVKFGEVKGNVLGEIGIEPSFRPVQARCPASLTSIALAIAAVAVSGELHPIALLQLS